MLSPFWDDQGIMRGLGFRRAPIPSFSPDFTMGTQVPYWFIFLLTALIPGQRLGLSKYRNYRRRSGLLPLLWLRSPSRTRRLPGVRTNTGNKGGKMMGDNFRLVVQRYGPTLSGFL